MLTTLENVKLIDTADEIAEMILNSDIAGQYRNCLYNMSHNKESQRKIQAFTKLKEHYEEVQRFGRYHPEYKTVMKTIREVKREMDLDPYVSDFKKAENELQSLLDSISKLIGHSVSDKIKVPSGNPFFDTLSGCGGGCGSGGGCGC